MPRKARPFLIDCPMTPNDLAKPAISNNVIVIATISSTSVKAERSWFALQRACRNRIAADSVGLEFVVAG